MDLPLRINQLKFKENGGCGYILKPKSLLECSSDLTKTTHTLTIKILSAEQLPRANNVEKGDVVDPYVKLSLYHGTDHDIQTFKTKVVSKI
jgi:phosphatidylinositol phospholipase C, delta